MAQARPTRSVGTVADFLAHTQALDPDAFATRYPHPFLLEIGPELVPLGAPRVGATLAPGHTPVRGGPGPRTRVVKVRKQGDPGKFRHVTVGRTPNNDIAIPEGTVSKFHAYFMAPEGTDPRWRLVDVSTFGTLVDGKRLEKEQPEWLANVAPPGAEARITFGDRAFLWVPDPRRLCAVLRGA